MYFYAMYGDKTNWVTIDDTASEGAKKDRKDYQHRTVYAYSEDVAEGGDPNTVRMKGPFALDIDYKPNEGGIPAAIDAMRRILKVLESWDVNPEYVNIWASGGKGFHVEIPARLYGEDKSQLHLNKFHGWMAGKLKELADNAQLDMGLYSWRHMLRYPGQRSDGRWKVPVAASELATMTEEDYHRICSGPREGVVAAQRIIPKDYVCEGLKRQYELGKVNGRAAVSRAATTMVIGPEFLEPFTDEKLPHCIELMRDASDVTGNYNDISMQFGAFLGNAQNLSEGFREKLLLQFARKYTSDSKSTLNSKLAHTKSIVEQAKSGNFEFSCGGCRKVLSVDPCKGCPVQTKKQELAEQASSISEDGGCLWFKNAKGEGTKIANFAMTKMASVCTHERGGRMLQADDVEVRSVDRGNEVRTTITIPSEDWVSLAAFKRAIQKAPGALVLTGTEGILPLLQMYLATTQEGDVTMKVDKLGIHISPGDDGEDKATWVEPGWSIDGSGVASGYSYEGFAPDSVWLMRGLLTPKGFEDYELNEVLLKLMDSNRPHAVGHMLGWASACHLKEHLFRIGRPEFPLLHIAGLRGSGKTHTATVYSAITGTRLIGGPIAVDGSNPSPIRQALSQTTTVARVFDEFNKPMMGPDKYLKILAYLKAAYVRQNLAIGFIAKTKVGDVGAATSNEFATAPVIFMSKEATDSEELLQRSIVLKITESAHYEANYKENFQEVYQTLADLNPEGHPLQRLCRLLVSHAITIKPSQCRQWYEEAQKDLPLDKHSRTINNLFVIRLGLRFMREALASFPAATLERLAELDKLVIDSWHEAETLEQMQREFGPAEKLLSVLAEMAHIGEGSRTPGRLVPGHYVREGKKLWLSAVSVYQHYLPYTRYMQHTDREISSPAQLIGLFREKPYLLGEMGPPGRPNARGWICLDISQLENVINFEDFESI